MSFGSRYNQHSFAKVPEANIPRSKFDRSHNVKTTMQFDKLHPIFVDEVVPGDTCNLSVQSFFRLAPQVRPMMDNLYIDFHFFYVPYRLVWTNFTRFMGERKNPSDTIDYLVPSLGTLPSNIQVGSIFDHFGIPTGIVFPTNEISALPFRAWNLIWNEWFRDENLQARVPENTGNGPDVPGDYDLWYRGKRHDYFTSCLTAPQKGAAMNLLPALTNLPVATTGVPFNVRDPATPAQQSNLYRFGASNALTFGNVSVPAAQNVSFGSTTGLQVDISSVNATINDFRLAMMWQTILELDNRGGTRYVELIKSHFGVTVPDFRLQRPEFLSGGTIKIQQHPLAQTSETTTTSPQANLSAFSTASSSGNHIGFTKSIPEHGVIIGIASARGDITYQQGLNKMWSRRTRQDFYWPKLQEIGEQAVLRKEIYMTSITGDDNTVFGYQERFAEMRYKPSEIRSQFRSTYAQSLDVWHVAEKFTAAPFLNPLFIQSTTPIQRSLVLPDPNYPHLLCDYWFDYKHARPLVTYGVPAGLGRF